MGICVIYIQGEWLVPHHHIHWQNPVQLRNPDAKSFTSEILRKAMLETIADLNSMTDEVGITEVRANACVVIYRPSMCSSQV